MTGTYDLTLVALSVVIAMMASYVALDMAGRVTAAEGRARLAWLAGGSAAMGIGIWSMHFVGMLAFRLSLDLAMQGMRMSVPMMYDVPGLLLSVVVAVAASALALVVASRPTLGVLGLLAAASFMGPAIAGMHYIGMDAMRVPARLSYDRSLVALSVVIAVAASFAALWLARRFREDEAVRGRWLMLGSGAVMGLAIVGMHYTGMAAARFTPVGTALRVPEENVLATDGLATAVVLATLVILGMAILGSIIDRRSRVRLIEARALRFLAEASSVLASSLDYETTLANVARLVVPELADWCAVDLLQPDGSARRLAVVHHDPAKVEWARALQERYPTPREAPSGLPKVLRTGEPEFYPVITDAMLVAHARNEEHLRIMRQIGFCSAVIVPLVAHERVLGAITLVTTDDSWRRYTDADLALAQDLARRATAAIENARLFREVAEAREELAQAAERLRVANEGLARQTAAAEAASQAKTQFLTMMSHELRTPLNAIGGYTELMEMGLRGPVTEAQREDLRRIRRAQHHLLAIINDILNLARIEAGQIPLEGGDVRMREVLEEVEALIAPQLAAKGLRYECLPCDSAVAARADREKVQQVVLNLVSNAIKFTDAGGSVTLACEAIGDVVAVRVADTGRGIPPEKLEVIFDPFVQVDTRLTRTEGGAGLGLAISRELARAMGGEVTVESVPGAGSTFTLTLPRGAAARRATPAGGSAVAT